MRLPCAILAATVALAAAGCAEERARSHSGPPRPPVVVLILDEFPLDNLLTPDGGIDAERFPGFGELARISTWFPNAHSVYDSTFKAVPSILDARLPKRGTAPDIRSHHNSIYTLLGARGYRVIDGQAATAVCPRSVCKGARTRRPGVLAQLAGNDRPARLHRWLGSIRRRAAPTLYLQHALLPHEPWIYLPSGRQNRPPGEDPIPGINKPWGFHDPDLSLHNHQRHLLQTGYVDRQIRVLLARLRRIGLLDKALLAVVADHGYAFEVGVADRRQVTATNVHEIAPVPFFLKRPGQTEGDVDESVVRTVDLVPTLADLLDVRIGWRHDGASAFASATRARKMVRIVKRDFSATIAIDVQELRRRRQQAREHWAQVFGTGEQSQLLYGSPWGSVYQIGRHAQLLGRRVGRLASARGEAGDGVVATLANARLLQDVRADAPIYPTRVTGRIDGGRPGRLRDVAVAINGRVAAVGRSFRLRGRPRESYSLVVPEEALREGRNRVELFEVRADGRLGPRLYGTR